MKLNEFKLERYFAQYEFKAKYLLSNSDCEATSVGELLDLEPGAAEKLHDVWLGYTESAGDPLLRQGIAKLYETMQASDILVHSGAEEAIFNFMNSVLEPGDHVIVHYPCYQSLFEVAAGLGCEITRWEADEQAGWELELEFLWSALRDNTKAIIINSPHNPTGYLMSRDKLEQIVKFARENDLILFADEVYRGLEYNEAERLPAACDLYDKAVSLGVMSKSLGLPGLRIGWVATHSRRIYAKMAAFKDYLTICNSAPSEYLATLALRHTETLLNRNRAIALANLSLLDNFFERYSHVLEWVKPKAGAIGFVRFKAGESVEKFCTELVEQKGVMLLPSTTYDYANRHFRLGFGRKNMPEALAVLEEFLQEKYPQL